MGVSKYMTKIEKIALAIVVVVAAGIAYFFMFSKESEVATNNEPVATTTVSSSIQTTAGNECPDDDPIGIFPENDGCDPQPIEGATPENPLGI